MTHYAFVTPPPSPSDRISGGPAPTFSVVIAAYQAAATVGEAVESALEQTAPPLEVIVCDDGSTDDIESALAPHLGRIVLLRKQNGGEASAKNAGAREASGDFVAILDADDVYLPERLEALAELAHARPDLDILTTDALLELDGQIVRRCYEQEMRFEVEDQRRAILEQNFVFGHVAVRRERLLGIGGFDEAIRWTTDWDCWLRMIFAGSRAGLVDQPLSRYRLVPGSLTSQRARLYGGRLATLEKASRRADLQPHERRTVGRSLERDRRLLALAEARESLLGARPDARRRSLAVVAGRGFGARTRAKALASAVAPGMARSLYARRPRETTAGILVSQDAQEQEPAEEEVS